MNDFSAIPPLGAEFFAGLIKYGVAGPEYRQRAFLSVENDICPSRGCFGWEVAREPLLGDRSTPIHCERYDLRIGSVLVVVVTVAIACRIDSNRIASAESPAADVQCVHAIVA